MGGREKVGETGKGRFGAAACRTVAESYGDPEDEAGKVSRDKTKFLTTTLVTCLK